MSKQRVQTLDSSMAFVEQGQGQPIVFLHGNPTSSFLWRNVIPSVARLGRCIAPDLIGMGDSDKLQPSGPERYRFSEHARYLDACLQALVPDGPLILVVHDWGSALGFDWARRNASRVRGLVYMEAIVRPLRWDEWNQQARPIFEAFRGDAGEDLILQRNLFVERVLPGSILRELEPEEMAEYRRPFAEPGEARRPTLSWPREIPLDGEPADVVAIVQRYADWLRGCQVPKLFVNADPGAILIGAQREFCRGFANQTEVTVRGSHFLQEDSGAEIGQAIARWLNDRGLVATATGD
ncbi:MAG: haloalkane dehalogenase [Gammaproteobacteria bacterium]|nr:haloalkane dehalogenase [Gammaproteobacteria bacterium]